MKARRSRGRRFAAFAYRVPLKQSHYGYSGRTRVMTAYEGTFLVDPSTYDLVRLVVRTSGLPPETGSCEATTTLDYKRVRLNDAALLLPSATRLQIVNADGSVEDNRTVFSDCHQFLGESVVTFGDPSGPASSKPDAPVASSLSLPEGLPFEAALTQNIDTSTAAVGDPVKARLTTPIRDGSSRILVPAGTPAVGRIVEMRHFYSSSPVVAVSIRLEALTLDGTPRPFAATLKPATLKLPRQRGLVLTGHALADTPPEAGRLVLDDPKHNLVIRSDLKLNWLTSSESDPAVRPQR